MPITFGKLLVWTCDVVPPKHEQHTRCEVGFWLYETLELDWFAMFQRQGLGPDDVVPGEHGGMPVKQFVKSMVKVERDKLDKLSVDEWWAYRVDPHPELLSNAERQHLLMMCSPPAPRRGSILTTTRTRADVRHALQNLVYHYTHMILCEVCIENNFSG